MGPVPTKAERGKKAWSSVALGADCSREANDKYWRSCHRKRHKLSRVASERAKKEIGLLKVMYNLNQTQARILALTLWVLGRLPL